MSLVPYLTCLTNLSNILRTKCWKFQHVQTKASFMTFSFAVISTVWLEHEANCSSKAQNTTTRMGCWGSNDNKILWAQRLISVLIHLFRSICDMCIFIVNIGSGYIRTLCTSDIWTCGCEYLKYTISLPDLSLATMRERERRGTIVLILVNRPCKVWVNESHPNKANQKRVHSS